MSEQNLAYQLVVIGGGPAGLAAAISAYDAGVENILIVERAEELGGILNQCIHNGFGLSYFKEELTGPEYASRFIQELEKREIDTALDSMVLRVDPVKDGFQVVVSSAKDGYRLIQSGAVILAMGCRERTRGAIQTPGSRPSGVLTAGSAQYYVNIEGKKIGKRILILGSGDIGLIMARRMALEGAEVLACVELMPDAGGLTRNLVQCLDDFGIPLLLSHTVTKIEGKERLQRVTVQAVDEVRKPIPGTEKVYEVDSLLLSVGLIPENELSRECGVELDPRTQGPMVNEKMQTVIPGMFACGNVLHVHDLADEVSRESELAGRSAASYLLEKKKTARADIIENKEQNKLSLGLLNGQDIAYTVPQRIDERPENALELRFRVRRKVMKKVLIELRTANGKLLASFTKPYVLPGEMQKVRLATEIWDELEGDSLELSMKEQEA